MNRFILHLLLCVFCLPQLAIGQVNQEKMLAKAASIEQFKSSMEVVRTDVSVFSAGDLATGYYAGSNLELIELVSFSDEGEGTHKYYFDSEELFLVTYTLQAYNENIFQLAAEDQQKQEPEEGGQLNEDGEFVTDWDWGIEEKDSASVDNSWTDEAFDMFAEATVTHYFLRKGHIALVADGDGKELEKSLDFYQKEEESLLNGAFKARESLLRKR